MMIRGKSHLSINLFTYLSGHTYGYSHKACLFTFKHPFTLNAVDLVMYIHQRSCITCQREVKD